MEVRRSLLRAQGRDDAARYNRPAAECIMLREAVSPARDEFEVRLKQQSMLADFGRRALAIDDLDVLLRETAVLVAQGLGRTCPRSWSFSRTRIFCS